MAKCVFSKLIFHKKEAKLIKHINEQFVEETILYKLFIYIFDKSGFLLVENHV